MREAGFQGSITLLSEEPWAPYERPPLSKEFLRRERESLELRPAAQYEYAGIDLRLHKRVVEVDVERRQVLLADSPPVPFDLLLLATGRTPRRLPDAADALYLRRVDEARALRSALDGGSLHILGAGFIGCEVAASARALGCQVVLQEAAEAPLLRVLGPRLGGWLAGVHRANGVEVRLGVAEVPVERPLLVAIGTEPRSELGPIPAGTEGVFAAGDCSSFFSPIYGREIQVEHFQTAWRHGAHVGRVMAGATSEPFAEAPWFWSDQYDLNLQYAGAGVPWDEEVVRGSFGEPPFTVFQLSGGELVGALGVNDARTISRVRRLLEARVTPARAELEDPGFDLRRALP